jgi:hypothetical protein
VQSLVQEAFQLYFSVQMQWLSSAVAMRLLVVNHDIFSLVFPLICCCCAMRFFQASLQVWLEETAASSALLFDDLEESNVVVRILSAVDTTK